MNYAFAIPKSDSTVSFDGDKTLLTRLVKSAHGAKSPSKVVLSVGGWGNSAGFSGAVASDSSRKKFVQTFVDLQKQYNLDGFDFDWEYPNNVQNGRRASSDGQDTTNFQTFLQQLRAALPAGQMITAAVPQTVWLGSNGQPVGSVARAGDALDYIVIMNYDVNGASSTPGPNAPLANLCGNSSQPTASAAAGVKQWTAAGMPRKKILLGVPAYGYVQNSSKLRLKGRSLKNSEGTTANGQVNFNLLVEQGALKKGSDGLFDGANGWTKYWTTAPTRRTLPMASRSSRTMTPRRCATRLPFRSWPASQASTCGASM
ncbi:hypothetical protein L7F22_022590 [Adiantum nelumboides]|nr:hypothetical protein [Adiantum nelumboides]